MAQQRATIEEFGIVRGDEEDHHLDAYTFLIPFTGPAKNENEWISRQVRLAEDTDPWGLQQYAINGTKRAYVLFSAFLLTARADDGRKTRMRLWQMIVANWIEANNTPDSLRYVGVSHVVNIGIRKLLAAEWKHQIAQGQVGFGTPLHRMLTITPTSSLNTFQSNTFVHLIRTPEQERNVQWHMVLEFKRGNLKQNNYRQRLMRRLLPMVSDKLEGI